MTQKAHTGGSAQESRNPEHQTAGQTAEQQTDERQGAVPGSGEEAGNSGPETSSEQPAEEAADPPPPDQTGTPPDQETVGAQQDQPAGNGSKQAEQEGKQETGKNSDSGKAKPQQDQIPEKAASGGTSDAPSGQTIRIHFVGDMIFSGKVETLLESKGYSYPFTYLGDLFKKDDLTLGNLETPVTTRGVGAKNKTYVFKSSPKALDALRAAGMDAVTLANNHILDQGEEGLLDTVTHLGASGIKYVGAGKNAARAYAPEYFSIKGMKVALVGASRVYPESSWAAGTSKPGVASAYGQAPEVLKSIAEARKNADLVIVMAHWGIERQSTPDANQKALAHAFVDAGADLIIGAHPHVLQGLEQYKGKWIAYSTGNFIFTKSTVPATWKTAVFEASCRPEGGCGMKLIPYKTELGQPVPMTPDEGKKLMQEMQQLSIGGVRVSGDGTVTTGSAR
ncbi:poly-gamma-glutamate synthesis protein (capsule biosynthesis protein) [Paenibacillus rhizosphaerae]|uniref:Poly-gamma-glutamate synthesis protein (Capsule biosynthesis protein) n=1 Tax=Paenibacillus rhizosphaerae TaxID=297318 RepID=A0A839TQS6_9BACL|nr:CapA family protein [Paenibacillus rhizosphaerae]MBB3128911.1 poly-gamma-glutamate synthesis protein (capsule biosynthesis protein) [Paenibacillus rhizosphaerae]